MSGFEFNIPSFRISEPLLPDTLSQEMLATDTTLEPIMSRPEFIKWAGLAVLGIALGDAALHGCNKKPPSPLDTPGRPILPPGTLPMLPHGN